jgi:hypothetical protein
MRWLYQKLGLARTWYCPVSLSGELFTVACAIWYTVVPLLEAVVSPSSRPAALARRWLTMASYGGGVTVPGGYPGIAWYQPCGSR